MNRDQRLRQTAAAVADGLWVGGGDASIPPGTRRVVTVAADVPPFRRPGIEEFRATFVDSRWRPIDRVKVSEAIAGVCNGTFVRCRHGINRSPLIAALVLRARGVSAARTITQIRNARPEAFTNPYFHDLVLTWPADPMATRCRPRAADRDDHRGT